MPRDVFTVAHRSGRLEQEMSEESFNSRVPLGRFGPYGFTLETKREELILRYYDEVIEKYKPKTRIGAILIRCREHLAKINDVDLGY